MKFDWKRAAKIALPVLLAALSVFVLAKPLSSVEFHADTIAALDEKRNTVLELTAASTAASAAITLLPGDTATPIADKLADLSGCFLLVLCAIFLEKYLLTAASYAAFAALFPAALLLLSAFAVWGNEGLKHLAKKLAVFGLAALLTVPVSVKVSQLIETTYHTSIEAALERAKGASEEMEEAAQEEEEPKEGFLAGIINQVEEGVSNAVKRAEAVLSRFLEALAVMLVTSCVIPVVVLLFLVWLVKVLLSTPIDFSGKGHGPRRT